MADVQEASACASAFLMVIGKLYLDLDHFKAINDRYGHAAGDEALRCVGRILARYLMPSHSIVGRLGGEEFGVFQSGLMFDEMLGRCEQLREEIAGIMLYAPSGSRDDVCKHRCLSLPKRI